MLRSFGALIPGPRRTRGRWLPARPGPRHRSGQPSGCRCRTRRSAHHRAAVAPPAPSARPSRRRGGRGRHRRRPRAGSRAGWRPRRTRPCPAGCARRRAGPGTGRPPVPCRRRDRSRPSSGRAGRDRPVRRGWPRWRCGRTRRRPGHGPVPAAGRIVPACCR
ncbi:hypothetical protein G6F59_017072 [Rhizopus arrhizus]|nr:hypothetical protein G6F59_017072 [Rhizopus arrhizus]